MSVSLVSSRRLGRRALLHIGGLSMLGLNAWDLTRLRAHSPEGSPAARHQGNACVFIFLFGGPSHIDLWDMKPEAPAEIRGEFKPIDTVVPGIQICEHLPRLARVMDRLVLVRSMTHRMPVHGPACSEMYTGREYFGPPTTDEALPEDWPSVAALVARFGASAEGLPPSVVLPLYSHFVGQSRRIAGQTGGRMGEQYNPVLIECDPGQPDFSVPGLTVLPDVGAERLARRRALAKELGHAARPAAPGAAVAQTYAGHAEMAYTMLQHKAFASALDLRQVPRHVRERYGQTTFGQSLLLARRLVEAGIPLVTVNYDHESKYDKRSPMWDTHHDNFGKLKETLCPVFDPAMAAFIEDLDERGLLPTTLVVATGEFGRTPRIGQFTQNAMTLSTGRDHWPYAFTVLLAGGGLHGGQVYGQTNAVGGHVVDRPVTPADLAATMLHHLGIDPRLEYHDHFQNVRRPLSEGRVIAGLS
jgi:hypothetical protein